MVLALLVLSSMQEAEARHETGRSGIYKGSSDWFEWGSKLEKNAAAEVNKSNTCSVAGGTLATTWTISNINDSPTA